MALIEHTLLGKIDKVQIAINRIKTFDPTLTGKEPYYVAYSGGKDSDTIRILCELANVKFDLVHNHTTVDAPETVYYVRQQKDIIISYPELSMWDLIVKKKMPPTRIIRYCCDYLKERSGTDRFVMTGVRWEESTRRKATRTSLEITQGKNYIKLNADNDESRRLLEQCVKKSKTMLNPIIDWSEEEVWELLNHYGCKSNPLYQCGYKRVGCVGCPMAGGEAQIIEFEKYPKYKEAYIRAFQRAFEAREAIGKKNMSYWTSGESMFDWWVSGKQFKQEEGQTDFEELEEVLP